MEYKHDWFLEEFLLIRVSEKTWMKIQMIGSQKFYYQFIKVVKKLKKNL